MKLTIARFARPVLIGLLALTIFTLASSAARADEVTFAGSTSGCFGAACVPPVVTGQAATATLLGSGLTFNGSTFSGTSSNGFLGIGANANPPNNMDNLGSFTLASTPFPYTGQPFALRVTFTAPPGITNPAGGTTTFSATLLGNVSAMDTGGLQVTFNMPGPILFTFSNASGAGSFSLTVNNVAIQAPDAMNPIRMVPITGFITGAQQTVIPEPATLLLLGTGLTGLGAGLRRRYRASKE